MPITCFMAHWREMQAEPSAVQTHAVLSRSVFAQGEHGERGVCGRQVGRSYLTKKLELDGSWTKTAGSQRKSAPRGLERMTSPFANMAWLSTVDN